MLVVDVHGCSIQFVDVPLYLLFGAGSHSRAKKNRTFVITCEQVHCDKDASSASRGP